MRSLRRLPGRLVAMVTRKARNTWYEPRHPRIALERDALAETVSYIKQAMPNAMIMGDAFEVLTYAAGQVTLQDGLFLEFGVRTGSTINHVARLIGDRRIHGFDSFEGLPEPWWGYTQGKGAFGGEGIPRVAGNVELVIGWFDETLPGFLEQHAGPLALAHIDSDLYSSARTVLECLAPRIQPGSIVVFNEYFNIPNWKEHEYRAFQEFCGDHRVRYEYVCWGLFEVAVRILEVGAEHPGVVTAAYGRLQQ